MKKSPFLIVALVGILVLSSASAAFAQDAPAADTGTQSLGDIVVKGGPVGWTIIIIPILVYIAGFVLGIYFIWLPLIDLYGFLNLFGILIGINIAMFGAYWVLLKIWTYQPPKESTHA